MASCMSRENWLKGVLGLRITKDAIIPFLEEHYKQTYEDWNNGDNHLHHLLDLAAKGEVKLKKGEWEVNCSGCEPILKDLMTSHLDPKYLTWKNITYQDHSVPKEYRLPKVYMGSGNEKSSNFNDRDPLAILQICKYDKRLDLSYEAFVLLKKPMICEIDESNEIWKMAISIKEMAQPKESKGNPEALKVLLERIKDQLQREQHQRQSAESTLATSQRELNDVRLELQINKNKVQLEKERADCTRNNLERERNQRANEKSDYGNKERTLLEENRTLKEEVEELKRCNPSLEGRIAKGTATGTVVGIAGGPVGLAVGAAAGGVVGGISYFWDKITGK